MRKSLALGLLFLAATCPLPASSQDAGPHLAIEAISYLPSQVVQQRLDGIFYRWQSYKVDLPRIHRMVKHHRRRDLSPRRSRDRSRF